MSDSQNWDQEDVDAMQLALEQALAAGRNSEVPVGAVVMLHSKIVSGAGNRSIGDCDPSAHAEILALREAAKILGNHRLTDATLYVTLEPCVMCTGAIAEARIRRVVFGAYDKRAGALCSTMNLATNAALQHHVEVNGGLLEEECRDVLQGFFEDKRN